MNPAGCACLTLLGILLCCAPAQAADSLKQSLSGAAGVQTSGEAEQPAEAGSAADGESAPDGDGGAADPAAQLDLDEESAETADGDSVDVDGATGELDLGTGEVAGTGDSAAGEPLGSLVQSIDSERIVRSGAANLADLLQREALFSRTDSVFGSELSTQGLPSRFTTVLLNGQRIAGRVNEILDLSQIPLDNVQRVDVLRGPQAARYSGLSAGAVINIITQGGGEAAGSLTLGLGSLGFNEQRLQYGGGSADNSWSFGIGRSLREAYDLNARFPDTDGDSYRQQEAWGGYSGSRGQDSFDFQASWLGQQARGADYAPVDQIRSNDSRTQRLNAALSYRWALGSSAGLTLSQNYSAYRHGFSRFYEGFKDETFTQTGFSDTVSDTQLSYETYGTDHIFSAGLQVSHDKLASDRLEGAAPGRRPSLSETTRSAYGSWEQFLSPRLSASLALRADDAQQYGMRVSPKLALSFKLDPASSLTAGYGRGFRAPSLRERNYEFASPFGYSIIGNDALRPERTSSYSLDYSWRTAKAAVTVGAFRHEVGDLIEFSEIRPVPQVFQPRNVESALSQGLELNASRRWQTAGTPADTGAGANEDFIKSASLIACVDPAEYAGVELGAVWLPVARDQATGNRLAGSPELDQRLRVYYQWPRTELSALLHSSASRYLDGSNLNRAPAFRTLDLTARRGFGWGELRLAALNVTDVKDGRHGPEPGRELRLECSLSF